MQPIRRRVIDSVTVEEFEPDWNDLAWFTLQLLGAEGHTPGVWEKIVMEFFNITRMPNELGTRFVNPRFVVTGPKPSRVFTREARRAQLTWLKQLKDVFARSGLRKQQIKKEGPIHRQLSFTGVMIIEGKYLPPDVWWKRYQHLAVSNRNKKTKKKSSPPKQLEGQRFSRLLVLRRNSEGRWLCRCDCGTEKAIRACHLRSGLTKSCGCLKKQVEQRQKARKEPRK